MRKADSKKADSKPSPTYQQLKSRLEAIKRRRLEELVNPEAFKVKEKVVDGKVTLSREMIVKGRLPKGGWNRKQMQLLGLPWPLVEGWMDRAVGTVVSAKSYRRFLMQKCQ